MNKVSVCVLAGMLCCCTSEIKYIMPLTLVYRKALVCIPGEKIFHCKRGTTLYFVDIKLSRRVAPSHRCHHRGINEDNSTLPNDNRCNATKVIGKIRKRCQGRRECWINLSERHLGKACVREVKFLRVNFTCDQSKSFFRSTLILKKLFL